MTESVKNAIDIAQSKGYSSIAFPLIGAGTGGLKQEKVLNWMREALINLDFDGDVRIVQFEKSTT